MCIFHKYKDIKFGIGVQEETSIFGGRHEKKAKVVIQECSKCSKKKAIVIDQEGNKRKIAIWLAEDILGDEDA